MKRRKFLKISGPLAATPFVLNGMPMKPFSSGKMTNFLASCDGISDRVLVLIQLKGGNDGINMMVPMNQYDKYKNIRPTIALKDTGTGAFIPLDSTVALEKQIGLHPAMIEVKDLYDQGKATVVQGVGYELPNQSHFKATDLWLTGGDGTPDNFNLGTGWPARYLEATFPDVHGEPIPAMLDPLGIQVGDSKPSLGFHSESEHPTGINLSGQNPAGFYNLVQTIGGAPIANVPASEYGAELEYIMGVESSVSKYAQRITDVFNAGSNSSVVYPTSSLANQLKTVARLVKGGSKTKVYMTQIGGFDTHNNQVDVVDTSIGDHAELLSDISKSVKAFIDDLENLGLGEEVLAVTFSEFGRCAKENGSFGCDHGTLAPMILFGRPAKPGIHGDGVNLSDLTNDGQVKNQSFDYRQVFTTVLQDFLGANDSVLDETLFGDWKGQKLNLIDKSLTVDPGCYIGSLTPVKRDDLAPKTGFKLFPNPAVYTTELFFLSPKNVMATVTLIDAAGRTVISQAVPFSAGENFVQIPLDDCSTGQHFVRLETRDGSLRQTAKLMVVK